MTLKHIYNNSTVSDIPYALHFQGNTIESSDCFLKVSWSYHRPPVEF